MATSTPPVCKGSACRWSKSQNASDNCAESGWLLKVWGCMSVSQMSVSFFFMPCNTSDIVLNERRRKTFVILLRMYLDFSEHKIVRVLPVFPTQTVMNLFM